MDDTLLLQSGAIWRVDVVRHRPLDGLTEDLTTFWYPVNSFYPKEFIVRRAVRWMLGSDKRDCTYAISITRMNLCSGPAQE